MLFSFRHNVIDLYTIAEVYITHNIYYWGVDQKFGNNLVKSPIYSSCKWWCPMFYFQILLNFKSEASINKCDINILQTNIFVVINCNSFNLLTSINITYYDKVSLLQRSQFTTNFMWNGNIRLTVISFLFSALLCC